MAKITVRHKQDYTVLKNNMFRDKQLSLKARGLLATMLSLPKDWDYTTQGLTKILKDGESSIRSALNELEQVHYLERLRVKDNLGKFVGIEYMLYEIPHVDNPNEENPHVENPHVDNRTQLNTYISNTNELSTNELNKYISRGKRFSPPTIEQVQEFTNAIGYGEFDANRFIDYYESNGWMVGKTHMKNWKAAVRNWIRNNSANSSSLGNTSNSANFHSYRKGAGNGDVFANGSDGFNTTNSEDSDDTSWLPF